MLPSKTSWYNGIYEQRITILLNIKEHYVKEYVDCLMAIWEL